MTADCGEDWTPTTPAEHLRAQAATVLNQHQTSDLYDQGITSAGLDGMTTIDVLGRYL